MFVFCNKILVSAIIGSKLPSTFLTVSFKSLARASASSAMLVTSSTHSVATTTDLLTVLSVIAVLIHRIKTPTPAKKIPAYAKINQFISNINFSSLGCYNQLYFKFIINTTNYFDFCSINL